MDTAVLIWIIIGIVVVALDHRRRRRLHARPHRSSVQQRRAREGREAARRGARVRTRGPRERGARRAGEGGCRIRRRGGAAGAGASRAGGCRRPAGSPTPSTSTRPRPTKHRAEQEQTLRKADDVDPYVTTDAPRRRHRPDSGAADDVDRDGRADVHDEPAHRRGPGWRSRRRRHRPRSTRTISRSPVRRHRGPCRP